MNTKVVYKCNECNASIPIMLLTENTVGPQTICPGCGKENTAKRIVEEILPDNRPILLD